MNKQKILNIIKGEWSNYLAQLERAENAGKFFPNPGSYFADLLAEIYRDAFFKDAGYDLVVYTKKKKIYVVHFPSLTKWLWGEAGRPTKGIKIEVIK